jgi:hypothetical protein
MNKKARPDFLASEDDEFINELAKDWYFLVMFFNGAERSHAEQSSIR